MLKGLDKEVDPKYLEIARIAKERAPPDFSFVGVNVEDVAAVLKRMAIEQN